MVGCIQVADTGFHPRGQSPGTGSFMTVSSQYLLLSSQCVTLGSHFTL
ncbi:hypothetical protein [Wolbachia endosymbiont (group A) of Sympetrum striolatum]|nr:hypothetical protein [Wolbachia endosymbiont (group A) of Sympetrum striolatum]